MILSDREISAALNRKAIKITPRPDEANFASTSVDLTLAKELSVWTASNEASGEEIIISPASENFKVQSIVERYTSSQLIDPNNGFIFEPGAFLLAWTVEKISLPHTSRIAARVEGKSSLARLGIGVHVTAPTVHAGFGAKLNDPDYLGAPLQLEMWNMGKLNIKLKTGMKICQLIFEWVDGSPKAGYEGQFVSQGPPTK